MKVSVLLCTYNGEQFLPEQLQSYAEQTQAPDELVVCDDGSTDDTLNILRDFKNKAKFPVRIHENKERLGYAKNFIQGLRYTTGDIILLSDQDDVWYPQKVARFAYTFESDPLFRLVFSNAELIDEQGEVLIRDYFGISNFYDKWDYYKPLSKVMAKNYGFVNGFLLGIHKKLADEALKLFDANPDFELNMGHDHFISILCGLLYEPVFVKEIPYVLVKYRQHDNQVIGATYSQVSEKSYQKSINDKLAQKEEHIKGFHDYLKRYKEVVLLLNKNHEIISFLNQNIDYQEERVQALTKNKVGKVFFSFTNFLSGKYHKYTQYPIKEAIRDIL